jgi:hypothetical protein
MSLVDAQTGTSDNYNTKQEITAENLFVLFLYFNPTDNSDAGGNG